MNSLARLIRLMTSRSSREHATGGCHTPGRTTPTTPHTGRDTLAPLEAATYPIRIPIRLPRRPPRRPGHLSVPSEATIRPTLARLDADALAGAIGAWLADREGPDRRRRAVAVDGKTLRGARRDGRQVHLLAAMDHATRAVVAQRQVDGALGEVPGLQPLLADRDLAGMVVTADALHTHRGAAEFLVVAKRAHYLFTVKANQPTLLKRCAELAWHRVPVLDRKRKVGGLGGGAPARRWQTVTAYAITSLSAAQASPARLADWIRGH